MGHKPVSRASFCLSNVSNLSRDARVYDVCKYVSEWCECLFLVYTCVLSEFWQGISHTVQ